MPICKNCGEQIRWVESMGWVHEGLETRSVVDAVPGIPRHKQLTSGLPHSDS